MSNLTSNTTACPTNLVPTLGADSWRDRHGNAGGIGHTGPVSAQPSVHNSMKPADAAPVSAFDAGRRVYAAKQAAPPRGRDS